MASPLQFRRPAPSSALQVYGPLPRRWTPPPAPPKKKEQQQPAAAKVWQPAGATPFVYEPTGTSPYGKVKSPGGSSSGGLGFLLNNPVMKNVLVPALSTLALPQRAVASTIQETGDLLAGRGFSGQDWMRQTGDAEFGMGSILPDTGNKWVDRMVGFVGDVATDPLTYVGGFGVARKLGQGPAAVVSRQALSGRPTRNAIVGRAVSRGLADQTLTPDTLGQLARVQQRGLGTTPTELLDTLQLAPPALRLRAPFTRSAGWAVPGTEGMARGVAEGMGAVRAGINRTGLGRQVAQGGRAPIDLEGAYKAMGAGEMDPSQWTRAASVIDENLRSRRYSGTALNVTQRELKGQTGRIKDEMRRFPTQEDFIRHVEAEGGTAVNKYFDWIRKFAQEEFGVTIPQLSQGGLHYFPRRISDDFFDYVGGERLQQRLRQQRAGQTAAPLTQESGFLAGREFQPGTEFMVKNQKTGLEETFSLGDNVSREAIEAEARRVGFEGQVFDTDVVGIMEDYTQAIADDIGRRASRADMAVMGNPYYRYLDELDEPLPMPEPEGTLGLVVDGSSVPSKNFDPRLGPGAQRTLAEETDHAREVRRAESSLESAAAKIRLEDEGLDFVRTGRVPGQMEGIGDAATLEWARQRGGMPEGDEWFRDIVDENAAQMAARGGGDATDYFSEATQEFFRDLGQDMEADLATMTPDDLGRFLDDLTAGIEAEGVLEGSVMGSVRAWLRDQYGADIVVDQWNRTGRITLQPVRSTFNNNIVMDAQVQGMIENLGKSVKDPKVWTKIWRKANRFFKTWATATPGFHVRNFLSAMYMNFADGVAARHQLRAMDLWADMERHAGRGLSGSGGGDEMVGWLAEQSPEVRGAFEAVFGSGAGGRFAEQGIADSAGMSRVFGAAVENPVTRLSQRGGSAVEGRVRLAVALDTMENGGSVADAIDRITRIHFDYGQLSRTDEVMRGFFPFWLFMSRNLPLQTMQMWSRPAVYRGFEHFRNNFEQEGVLPGGDNSLMPEYLKQRGAIPMELPLGLNTLDIDLPHVRLMEDIERWGDIGENPAGALSDMSPWITAPIEYATRSNLYTGQTFDDADVEHVSNPLEMALLPLAMAMGQADRQDGEWFIDSPLMDAAFSTLPVFDRASRLATGAGSGGQGDPERQTEMWLRFMGLPVRRVTERQVEGTRRGQYYDSLDAYRLQREMARQLQGAE